MVGAEEITPIALSLTDLNALIADPSVGAIHNAAHTAMGGDPLKFPADQSQLPPAVRQAAAPGIIASLNTSQPARPQVPAQIPSLAAPTAPDLGPAGPTAIPTIGAEFPAPQAQPAKPQESGWKKLEHGLATAGNIAGDIVAPGTMTLIPGTQLHNEFEQARAARLAGENARTGLESAQAGEAEAQGWKALHPEASSEAEMNFRAQAAEGLGLKPGTPEYQQFVGTGQFQRFAPQKPGQTPQEQTYDSLMTGGTGGVPQINPATQKPYTAQEALAATQKVTPDTANQDRERYEQIGADQAMGKPVKPEDLAWAKQYEKAGSLGAQVSAGAGTYQPLYDQNGNVTGFYDSKNPQRIIHVAGTPGAGPGAPALPGKTSQGQGMSQKEYDAFNKGYVDPANAIERSYDMFQDAYNAIKNGDAKTGAEDMLLLSQHLGTTFGQVKGSRMNKDLIQEHEDAIGMQDKIERFANNLASGQQLSPDQREEFNGLITNMRNLTWQIATKEAARRNQPINFLPANVEIKMQDSKGTTREVPGDQVQGYLDKGIKLAE